MVSILELCSTIAWVAELWLPIKMRKSGAAERKPGLKATNHHLRQLCCADWRVYHSPTLTGMCQWMNKEGRISSPFHTVATEFMFMLAFKGFQSSTQICFLILSRRESTARWPLGLCEHNLVSSLSIAKHPLIINLRCLSESKGSQSFRYNKL